MKNKLLYPIILLLLFTGISSAQTVTQSGFYAPLPSTFEGEYYNDHLFLTQQGMRVLDVADPANPVLSGSAGYPGSYAYQIAVNNGFGYMAEGGSGYFSVYNLSNPNNPIISGSVTIPSTAFMTGGDLVIENNYAYLTAFDTLFIIDVSNPSAPLSVNAVAIPNAGFQGGGEMAIDAGVLYMMTGSGLNVYDLSSPASPVLSVTVPFQHGYNLGISIDIIQHRLFTSWKSSLQTHLGYSCYDISSPLSPQVMFSDSISSTSGDFGPTAYRSDILILSSGGSVNVFNVNNTSHAYVTTFSGQSVANSTVSIEIKDSVFYNIRRGGVEVLKFSNWPVITALPGISKTYLEIFPNPVTDLLNFRTSANPTSVRIIDQLGHLVMNLQISDNSPQSVNVKQLAPGVYTLIMQQASQNVFTRFIRM